MLKIIRFNIDDLADIHYRFLKPNLEKNLNHFGGPAFKFLLKNLELVLKGTPNQLHEEIIEKIPKPSGKDIKKLKGIFNYSAFTHNVKYGAYKLAQNLNVRTCPYCNRMYTFTIETISGKTRPEFDHFYCQSTYPYLALSFYNLIPSCHICNSNLKGSNQFSVKTHINPFSEGFSDDIKFTVKLKEFEKIDLSTIVSHYGIDFFYGSLESFSLKLKVDTPVTLKQRMANNNIKSFKLEELYNEHKDYVVEIVQKAIIYNKDYINELLSQFPDLFRDSYDVKRMLLSNYTAETDLDKRVLSKLTKDISEEFGFL